MPCEIKWYVENRLLYERLYGVVTLEDVQTLNVQSQAYLNAAEAVLHIMIDLSEVERFPTSLSTIKEFIKPAPHAETLGWVVISGAQNALIKFLASVVTQITGDNVRMRMFDDQRQAIDFIRTHDETLAHITLPE